MSYNYTNGDGVSVLLTTEPNGATEPVSVLDQAIRQIKAYLNDPTVGPAAILNTLLPAGMVVQYGAAAAPTGWLICDGSAVSRTTYATLFAAIGTTYGAGNGSTTFNIPDGRDRSLRGKGAATSLGSTAGNDSVTLTIAQIDHQHTIGRIESDSGATADDFRFLISSDVAFADSGNGQQLEGSVGFERGAISAHAGAFAITSAIKVLDVDPINITTPHLIMNHIIKY
jgi:microcystin-dependent protein